MFLRSPDVAIDLGTANTRLFAAGRGLLAETPSIVGDAFHPLHRGLVVDVRAAAALLEPLIRGARRRLSFKPRALACIPSTASDDDRTALRQAASAAGACEVAILPEPLAAAVGAGLDVSSSYAQVLVDLGDGITDIAVIRAGQIIHSASLRTGCGDVRTSVIDYLDAGRGVRVADDEAERVVRHVCSLAPGAATDGVALGGADATIGSSDVRDAIDPVLDRIATFIREFVRDLPDGIGVEVIESGACITGGGARLPALVDHVRARTGLTVTVAQDPLHAVIRGAGRIITGRGANALFGAGRV